MALTRQRESAQVFVARETARDAAQLARQMGRGEVRAASVVLIHNAQTLESHGGVGPDSRPWTGAGWQAKAMVYQITA